MNRRTKIKNETYKLHHQLGWGWCDGASLAGQMGRHLHVGGLWLAVVVFAVDLRKEIYVGLWEWWVW